MLRVYLHAPFAACRTFTAGWYRPTAAFLTPSAAFGLLLNVAGIESRVYEHDPAHDGRVPASTTRTNLPPCRIALGIPRVADKEITSNPDEQRAYASPSVGSVFQQLHNYPVGRDAGLAPELAKGNKNNITPVRREVLVNLRAIIAVDAIGDSGFEDRIRRGLNGEFNTARYGLPFVGDNNYLIDRLELIADSTAVHWFQRVDPNEANGPKDGTTRLTIYVDRADMSGTRSALYAPQNISTSTPPGSAWTEVGSSMTRRVVEHS